VYGYPKDQALEVAVSTIRAFLEEQEMDVTLVIFDRGSFQFDARLCAEISRYMQHTMAPSATDYMMGNGAASASADSVPPRRRSFLSRAKSTSAGRKYEDAEIDQDTCADALAEESCEVEARNAEMMCAVPMKAPSDLVQALENLDESFSQALLRLIDERGMKDAECYKKANIDRKLFSKIRSDVHYRPSKQTVLAFAVALELNLPEAEALLKKAGYALSHSNKSDVIVEYFIRNRKYDIYSINEALFAFDQNLLGA
jgi:predicted transcriptional regulator